MFSKNIIEKCSFVNFVMVLIKGYYNLYLKVKLKIYYLLCIFLCN